MNVFDRKTADNMVFVLFGLMEVLQLSTTINIWSLKSICFSNSQTKQSPVRYR